MPRPKNDGKGRLGGRAKGVPNKSRRPLIEKAEELGVDPFEILLLFAKGDWGALGYASPEIEKSAGMGKTVFEPVISPELRQKSAKDACEYLHPKRKAIELSGKDGGPLDFYLSMPKEQRERLRKNLEDRLKK